MYTAINLTITGGNKMSIKHRNAVVVTGASSGNGRACALKLDRAGYQVLATFIQEFPPAGRQHYEQIFRNFVSATVAREKKGSPPEWAVQIIIP
jgi:NAD(P)-dependent dehydrogenase (short-subunit alcohol dehydrogenase family)